MKKQNELESLDIDKLRYLTKTDRVYGYRELCRILHLPIKHSGSNAQIKQLGALSNICEYEKVNSKYKFLHMRTDEEIALFQERATFTPLIECCLTDKFIELTQQQNQYYQDGILYLSMSTMLSWTGAVHENYMYIKNKNLETRMTLSQIHQFDLNELNTFMIISYDQVLKPMIRNALRTMDNKKSVTIYKSYKLYKESEIGYIQYTYATSSSPLGQEIEQIIADIYTEFNVKNVQATFFLKKEMLAQLYKRCDELCKERLGYDGFYDCYGILVHTERSKHNLQEIKREINHRTQDKLMTIKYLDSLKTSSKKEFIDTMIDIDTTTNFKNDYEEYWRMKMGI